MLIHAEYEVLDGEVESKPGPYKLEHGEDNVYVEEDGDPGSGVARPLVCHSFDNLSPGAVTHEQQVDDTGEAEQAQRDAEIVSGQLVLQAPAKTLQVLYLLWINLIEKIEFNH